MRRRYLFRRVGSETTVSFAVTRYTIFTPVHDAMAANKREPSGQEDQPDAGGVALVVYLVTTVLYGANWGAACTGLLGLLAVGTWFVLPLRRRRSAGSRH